MKKLIYLIVAIVAFGLIVAGCTTSVVPPTEQNEPSSLTKGDIEDNVYVDKNSTSSAEDGSEANPFKTITAALAATTTVDGDTILVAAGTYVGNLEIDVEGLTLKSTVEYGAVIQTEAGFVAGSGFGGITVLARGVTIDGFEIVQGVVQAIIHTHDSHDVTIKNNHIMGVDGARPRGIDIGYALAKSNGVLVEGNEFVHLYCGVYINQGEALTVEENIFEDMIGGALVFDGTWGNIDNIKVNDNVATNASNLLYFYNIVGSVTAEDNTLNNTKLSNYGVYNTDQNIYFSLIQDAIDEAEPYNTIEVAAGTYTEGITVNVEGLTIRGESLGAIVDGGFLLLADNITIDGLTIINGYNNRAISTKVDVYTSSKGHQIVNNDISVIKWAINIAACGTEPVNIVVDNNKIYDCRIAIMLEGYETTIINNEFYDNDKSGIEVEQSCNNDISYNSIYNNGQFGIRFCKAETTGNVVNRNNIHGNVDFGVLNDSIDTNPSPVDATCNWWGDTSGPSGVGSGTGDDVSANVTYSPWLLGSWPDGFCGIEVEIDIKPGNDPNSINLNSKGLISVAILTTLSFDATTVDWTKVAFGRNVANPAHDLSDPLVLADHQSDVDGDGDVDFVFHFRTQDTGIATSDTFATLTGETYGGIPIVGTDTVRIVGK